MISLFNIKYLFIYLFIFILYIKVQPYCKTFYMWKILTVNFILYYIKQLLILYNKYKFIIDLFIIKNMNLLIVEETFFFQILYNVFREKKNLK